MMGILRKIYSFLIDTAQSILLVFAVGIVVYIFLFRPFQVNGDSMHPTFLNNEYVLTNLITLRFNKPKLGDVIVFKAPPDREKDYIKRVIGVPGDTIMIKNGDVFVNGKLLDQSVYLKSSFKTDGGSFLRENETVTVPAGSYFVMGDNRLNSSDSRAWGFVPDKSVIGKSFFVYWPLNKFGIIKNPYN